MMFAKSSTLRLLVAVIIAGFCFLCAEAQTSLHVSVSTGADGPSCGTAGSPCASLQGALIILSSNPGIIFIAAGTYTGANNTNLNIAASSVSIVGIGLVTFSGGGSVRGWTLTGNNVVIENIVFSNFNTTGSFGSPLQRSLRNLLPFSGSGGAIVINSGSLVFSDCTFTSNIASSAFCCHVDIDARFLILGQCMVVLCMLAVVLRVSQDAPLRAILPVRSSVMSSSVDVR
jgi:hypothetical protein